MINKNQLLSSIFHPRKSNIQKDEKDILIEVENNTNIGIRLFLKNKKNKYYLFSCLESTKIDLKFFSLGLP